MAFKISTKIVIDGAAEYKKSITNINSAANELRSELKLVSEEFKGQENSLAALEKKNEVFSKQIENQAKRVELYTEIWEKHNIKKEEAGKKVTDLVEEFAKAEAELSKMENTTGTSTDALARQQETVKDLKDKLALAQSEYMTLDSATNNWQASLNNAQADLIGMNKNLETNEKYLDEAKNSTDQTAKSIDEFGKEVKETSEEVSIFGDVLKANLASEAIIAGVKKLASVVIDMGKNVSSLGIEFDYVMGRIQANSKATEEEMIKLKDAARLVGATTQLSAKESGDALLYMSVAGWSVEEMLAGLSGVADLAIASNTDLATTASIVTNALNKFGLEAADAAHFADILSVTASKSNTNIAKMAETFKYVGPIAATLGYNAEDTAIAIALMANNGIAASQAGTTLAAALSRLSRATGPAADEMDALGMKVTNADGTMKSLDEVMTMLRSTMSGLSETQKMQTAYTLFGQNAQAGMLAIIKASDEEYNTLKDSIYNCTGATREMVDILENTLQGRLAELDSALEEVGLTAYDAFEGTMRRAIDSATGAVERLGDEMKDGKLSEPMDDLSEAIANAADEAIGFAENALPHVINGLTWILNNMDVIAAGIGGLTAAKMAYAAQTKIAAVYTDILSVKTAILDAKKKGLTATTYLLNTAMKANPVGLLIGAFTGLAAAVGVYAYANKDAESSAKKLSESVKKNAEDIKDSISSMNEKFNESNRTLEIEAKRVKELEGELKKLNNQQNLTSDEQHRMKSIVEELNILLPELNLQIDEQTGKLDQNNNALEKNIEILIKKREIELAQEKINEIIDKRIKLMADLEKAEERQDELEAERLAKLNEYTEAKAKYNEEASKGRAANGVILQSTRKVIDAYEDLVLAGEEVAESVGIIESEMAGLNNEFESIVSTIDDASKSMNTNAKKIAELTTTQMKYKSVVYEVTEDVAVQMQKLEDAYTDAKEKATDSIKSQVGLFQELKIESDKTAEQMAENLRSQTDSFNQYNEDLTFAAQMIKNNANPEFEAILHSIMDMGVGGAGYLRELVKAAQTNEKEFTAVMNEFAEQQAAREQMVATIGDIQEGYSKGMESLLSDSSTYFSNFNDDSKDGWETVAQTHGAGGNEIVMVTDSTMNEMKKTIDEKRPLVTEAMNETVHEMVSTTLNGLDIHNGKSVVFTDIGLSIPLSIADGIRQGTSEIADAIDEMVNTAVSAVKIDSIVTDIDREIGRRLR